jgi:glycerol-3-phosphate dehydrogenase (NAD(P)+)
MSEGRRQTLAATLPGMRVAVIGAGSWGTAVAALAAKAGSAADVVLWARRPELAEAIDSEHENPDYLPGVALPPLRSTSDLDEALAGAEVVVMGVPSHGYRAVLEQAASSIPTDVPIVSLTKGIEQGTHLRMTQVTTQVLSDHDPRIIGVLSGPNLAREVMEGQPAATVIAMRDMATARALQPAFMTPSFRVYTNPDVIGAETAGALKNVMAIAAGIIRGLDFGMNTLATLITRALAEITRLGVAMGGQPLTFGGLAGVGDLMATCSSPDSRNNRVGYELGRGRKLDDIIAEMNMVAEGVKTTGAVLELAELHQIEMPIAEAVGSVLHEGRDPRAAVAALMSREAKAEGHGIAL